MDYQQIVDPLARLLGQDAASQVDNLQTDKTTGEYKPTIGDRIWGRADEGQKALNDQKNYKTKTKYEPLLEAEGLQYVEGESEGAILKRIKDKQDADRRSADQQAASDAFNTPDAKREREKEDKRWNYTVRQGQLERADAKELQAQNMELQRLQFEREDMRYNERMAKEDRARRRESIQSLATGLAALGAAFAM